MEAGLTMGFLFSVGFPLVLFLVGETERGGGGKTAMDWNLITNSASKGTVLISQIGHDKGRKIGEDPTHIFGEKRTFKFFWKTLPILRLMTTYPSLRVAYIDEVEEPSKDASKKINQKVYYSELVKAALPKSANSSEAVHNLDQVKTKALF
ncbi:Callose synthase 3 [Camellia lanceoleosa]|uniref:Callose synthase 3 n=1 Tax=Camellia lanceoleosa TaxID=1840588 RepID=A0ACC0GTL4_9ERIC|nr:Callose synthase 3 [Camellia lanceoleosa]